jgi:hypothetical protein
MSKKILIAAAFVLTFFNSCQNDDVEGLTISNNKPVATTTVSNISITEGEIEAIPFTISRSSNKPFTVSISIVSDEIVDLDNLEFVVGDLISEDSRNYEFDVPAYVTEFSVPVEALSDIIKESTETTTLMLSATGTRSVILGEGSIEIQLDLLDDGLACDWTIEELGNSTWSGTNTPGDSFNGDGPTASVASVSYDGTDLYVSGLTHSWIEDPDFWEESITNSEPLKMELDQSSGVVTVEEQYSCTSTWNGGIQPDYSVQATGLYDPCTKTITFNYDLIQEGEILDSGVEVITMD